MAVAAAHPNIALIKYWGNRDHALRLPSNGSISLTLGGLHTVTRVRFDARLAVDVVRIDRRPATPAEHARVASHLDLVRGLAGLAARAEVTSASDFPVGAGLASSASAFAALTLAATAAAGLDLGRAELSRLARRGSGSACRSIFGGFVEWRLGDDDASSFAEPLDESAAWPLADVIAIVSQSAKPVGSTEGHRLAESSPLQPARVASAPSRLAACRQAILEQDFARLAEVVELDCHLMHAVMQTSSPPLLYWAPASLAVMQAVRAWRAAGDPVCYTLDAGPNVHCVCPASTAGAVAARLRDVAGVVEVLTASAGGPAALLSPDDPRLALL